MNWFDDLIEILKILGICLICLYMAWGWSLMQ
jgi:hypothetical protein